MKKRILTVVFLLFVCLGLKAQKDSVYYGEKSNNREDKVKKHYDTDWLKRFTFGGNFQVYYSNYFSYVDLSPTIGFSPFERFNFGVGFVYFYSSTNYSNFGRYQQSAYGGHSYARYFIMDNLFTQVQYDRLRQTNVFNFKNPKEKVWVDYLLVGGGYSIDVGKNAKLMTSIMVNVSPHRLSIYPNPIIQFGFVAGF